jgi:membrane protein implicated in regulation of membrane protease activity
VSDSSTIGFILIIGGLILIAIEFVHPGAFLLIPGTVVLAGGAMYLVAPGFLTGTIYGPLIVAVVAVAAMFATIPYYRRMGAIHRPMSTTPDSLTGESGVVVTAVVPDSMRGKVRVHSEVWSARSDRPIPVGTRVRVQGGEGVSVWVQPLEADASRSSP